MTKLSSAPTRILFVNHTGEVSGAEKVLLQMVRGIDRKQFDVSVLCPPEGRLGIACKEIGVRVITMRSVQARFSKHPVKLLRSVFSIFQAGWDVRKQILKAAPDLLHANTVRAGIVTTIASIGTGIPVIWHVHDILPEHPISTGLRSLVLCSRRTRALCVSDATAKAFVNGWSFRNRVAVLHNGVELDRFPDKHALAQDPAEQEFRNQLALRPGHFLFCAVGQIAARKGLYELIEAFAIVSKAHHQAKLSIVGEAVFAHDQPYKASLLQLCKDRQLENSVSFVGSRSDVPHVMRSADTIVLNSHQEPFGLVLVEAMSSGTAVLATRVGGIPEIVTDGVTGWLVAPHDTAAMAARMSRMVAHRDELIPVQQAAQRYVCPRFSQSRFMDGLNQYYSNLDLSRRNNTAGEKAKRDSIHLSKQDGKVA